MLTKWSFTMWPSQIMYSLLLISGVLFFLVGWHLPSVFRNSRMDEIYDLVVVVGWLLRPKYTGIPRVNARGSWNQTAWSLQWVIYYMVKHHLETVLYKPLCHHGFKVLCAMYCVYQVEHGCWPSLCHCSPPSCDPVCSTLCSNCCNCLLARHVILLDFLWHVQCMVHGSWALGWFNPLFFELVGTSPHPAIWLRKVGLLSSQSEAWVDATCFLKIEHPRCAENQALGNHRCSVEHVLLHVLVKYTIQLALQNMFSYYTRYNRVVWALTSQQHACVSQGRICSDNLTCCHTETEVADQTLHLPQSQYTDTGPTSPSTEPITPGAGQGSHLSANFSVTGMTRPGKIPSQAGFEPRIFRSRGRGRRLEDAGGRATSQRCWCPGGWGWGGGGR